MVLDLRLKALAVAEILNELIDLVSKLASLVLSRTTLVSPVENDSRRTYLLRVMSIGGVLHHNTVLVLLLRDVHIGELNASRRHGFVSSELVPLGSESLAVPAAWVHEGNYPKMLVISNHGIEESVDVETQ